MSLVFLVWISLSEYEDSKARRGRVKELSTFSRVRKVFSFHQLQIRYSSDWRL